MKWLERQAVAEQDMTLILAALTALQNGDGSVRLPAEWTGLPRKVADAYSGAAELNQRMAEELSRLTHRNQELERKNSELERSRQALEGKAARVALTLSCNAEFIANLSHALRIPLHDLLILSDQLCTNRQGHLTSKQVELAKTIHSSSNDLLMLINNILDLSKIESGTVLVEVGEMRLSDLCVSVEHTFWHIAESKGLDFVLRLDPQVPKAIITNSKRLRQILKNLLSNAFKFTHYGSVSLSIAPALAGWSRDNDDLNRAGQVLAFSVADTGIGIEPDKQQTVFEAFQTADGGASRKYGGTGLGLAISRELSRLLGGEIRLSSTPGRGSTFVLYLPVTFPQQPTVHKEVDAATVACAASDSAQPESAPAERLRAARTRSSPSPRMRVLAIETMKTRTSI